MVNPNRSFQRPVSPGAVKSCKLPRRAGRLVISRLGAAALAVSGILAVSACSTPGQSNLTPVSQHNCLLPGQVTRVGGQAFLSARRAVTTDRANCEAQGGEPVPTSDLQVSADSQ